MRVDWPIFVEVMTEWLVAERYQRSVDETRVNRMAKAFDERKFGALVVAGVEGEQDRYALIDGQHRWRLAQKLNIEVVWVQDHDGLTYEQRALLFVELQRDRKNLTTVERFEAMLEARDERTLEINRIVRHYGFVIHKDPNHTGGVRAVTALEEAYRRGKLVETMAVASSWPTVAKYRGHQEVLRGLSRFFAKHPDVEPGDLMEVLDEQEINPLRLRQLAAEVRQRLGAVTATDENAASLALTDLWTKRKGK